MLSIKLNVSALRIIRFLIATCVCAVLVFSHAFPAYSAEPVNPTGSRTAAPQEGEAQLRSIEREAQEAVQEPPYSRGKTQSKANPGLNEIQGTADVEKMNRPENSQAAQSVEDKSKNFLDALTGKK
jgi:murein L,D-transpeptidase YcbB/YkuD